MEFRIADTFTDSLARLTGDEQKAVKTTASDLQINPASPGMSLRQGQRQAVLVGAGRQRPPIDRAFRSVGTMPLSKGLEFRAVAVMACDDEVVPLQARIEAVTEATSRRCTIRNVTSCTWRVLVHAITCW
jgi:hypothetical protein